MSWLIPVKATKPVKPAPTLRVQTALEGLPVAVLLGGQNRVGCNLIEYVDFIANPESSGGGKGTVGGGGGGKGNAAQSYTYKVAVICALVEGPVESVDALWNNKTKQTLDDLNFTAFLGTYSQNAWGYMTSNHPTRALPYRGICYAAAGKIALGDVPELPNLNFEVTAVINGAISGAPDADPADCIIDFLTNVHYGTGFPSDLVGTLSDYSDFCLAYGLVVSPLVSGQTASSFLADLLAATNSEARWSGGILDVVPYGDTSRTANGFTYTATTTPLYDLTDDDFIQADGGDDPVKVTRQSQNDGMNSIQIEYANRNEEPDPLSDESRAYNPAIVAAKNDAEIILFGLRQVKRDWHFFCLASAALMSGQLELGREAVRNTYAFTVGPRFILLDVMDIITITDTTLGLSRYPVRIMEITENADKSLTMVAEDYLIGAANPPVYGSEANDGTVPDYNVDPGVVNAPTIFEPTDELAGGLEMWIPLSGVDLDNWGGALVYMSTDDETYLQVGRFEGPSRTGVLTATLPTYTSNPNGQTIDATNTLSITLAESGGALTSGSQSDALALNTVCRVGTEYIAYMTATLTGAYTYDLTYMVRGAYGTEANIAAWPAATPFTRVDDSLMKLPFTADRVGATVYFKFASFNIYGGGQQSLADVPAYTYTILGTALASPLDNIENLRTTYVDNTSALTWDEISDFRPVQYEVRKGTTWNGALSLGRVAHPPFVTYGDGTYWVAGVTTPVAGLTAYSEDPTSIVISGSILDTNVVAEWDEQATGWPGYITGPGIIIGGVFKTTGAGVAYYEIPESHWFSVLYSRPTRLGATWLATGEPYGANILDIADFLNNPDILGALSAQYVTSFVEVATSTGTAVDIFSYADIFVPADIFVGDLAWGSWVKFAPGVYVGQNFKFRLSLEATDSSTVGDALDFTILADVDDRNDHVVNHALAAGGETFTFIPDGGAVATPFKGGPNGATVPTILVTILNATAGDDVVITGVTLAVATIRVFNTGVGVARTINATFTGY